MIPSAPLFLYPVWLGFFVQQDEHHGVSLFFSPQVLLACLIAAAAAAPQLEERPISILVDERSDSGDGNFNYNFETENGIAMEVSGTPGAAGQTNMQGVYR